MDAKRRPTAWSRASAARASTARASALVGACLALLLAWGSVSAVTLPDDAPLPPEAEAALAEGVAAAALGLIDPTPPHPDHAAWRLVLDAAHEALALSDHAITRRFLARAYAITGWSVRALRAFDELVEAGHPLDVPELLLVPDVSSATLYGQAAADMAFARYQAGDLAGAERVYARWLELAPESTEALRWLGRLALERGDPEAALPYWQRLVELRPEDAAAAYSLREAQREVEVGPMAAAAFRGGIEAYQLGDLSGALAGFEAALAANPAYLDAAVWAGRSALELGRPQAAVRYWSLVLRERPDDGGAAYFLRLAEDQVRFGVTAGTAFHDAMAAYERADLEAAEAALEASVAANDAFTQAWVWLARVRQELGRYQAAVEAWERVLALDPGDDRARYFAALARQQQGVSPAAGQVFAEAVAAYERADFVTADARLREVVAIDPMSSTAWAWLARVAFGERRYDDAARYYGRAAELDPSDDDLAFFAREAAALAAGESPPAPVALPRSEPPAPDPDDTDATEEGADDGADDDGADDEAADDEGADDEGDEMERR